ncbi:MAG: DUF2071 domain-containing protein [Pirellulales bacterium]|nr:DUF2071 domain-containing protein [Pirellulales bacterium]
MKLPVIAGVIDRRILVNYRVDPDMLARTLPAPFRPKLVRGVGLAGICLIRLRGVRPRGLPAWLGIASENAAHRTAVEWEVDGHTREGVFVRRRDTDSRLNALAGGRVFPGVHHHGRFDVAESAEQLRVAYDSDDGAVSMEVDARVSDRLPVASVFASLDEASAFFQAGSIGYSVTEKEGCFQGLELCCPVWQMTSLEIVSMRSSFFADESIFPRDAVEIDSAFLMRQVAHEWHARADLLAPRSESAERAAALPIA